VSRQAIPLVDWRVLLLMATAFLAGCEEPAGSGTAPNPGVASTGATSPPPPPPPPPGPPAAGGTDSFDERQDSLATQDEPERTKAEAGVGKKGRNYGGGVITEPIRQYFQVSQRIHFMNMEHAMRLYKAEFGNLPKSHDEFMDKIIKANSIELPELPEGERYVYDPARGELMVEKPAN